MLEDNAIENWEDTEVLTLMMEVMTKLKILAKKWVDWILHGWMQGEATSPTEEEKCIDVSINRHRKMAGSNASHIGWVLEECK